MTEAVCIDETRCLLGESPIWSPDEQALYWVDIQNAMIYRLHPESGERRNWPVETEIGSIGLGPAGKLVCGLRMGLAWFDLQTGEIEIIADPEGDKQWNTIRLNDGKVDRAGRYWCGSMEDPGHGPKGTLYRFDAAGNWKAFLTGINVPNAICWSPDSSIMYFANTHEDRIRAYDFDLDAGDISNERIFVDVAKETGHPDGATVDAEGYVWSAQIFAGQVRRYAPDGTLDRIIEIPTPKVTCCAFGGPNLDILYVTTASMAMDRAALAADPLAGKLFAIDVGVTGIAEPVFGG
jgi:L-arabinonolactonase